MCFDKYQEPIARRMIYATVGSRERGRMLKIKGSRIISTYTGGTLFMSVLFVV